MMDNESDYNQILTAACTSGNTEKLERLIKEQQFEVNHQTKKHGTISRLIIGIIKRDSTLVMQLIGTDDFVRNAPSYAELLGEEENRIGALAVRYGGPEMVKIFLDASVELESIYWESVRIANRESLELCLASPGVDQHMKYLDETALHQACRFNQLEISKLLIDKYGLDPEALNTKGHLPVFYATNNDFIIEMLSTYPEMNVNLKSQHVEHILGRNQRKCDNFTSLLEHGADLMLLKATPGWFRHSDYCYKSNGCHVTQHLKKLLLIDAKYVDSLIPIVLRMNMEELKNFENHVQHEYEAEIAKMANIRLSQSTSSSPGKTLLDFLLLGANEAARYSKNENVLRIYENHNQDFRKDLPHYGFALNYQLRRGIIRRNRLESAGELLCWALGSDVFEDFSELVFEYFSNRALKQFCDDMNDFLV